MTKSTDPIRVLLVSKDELISQSVKNAFLNNDDFTLLDQNIPDDGIAKIVDLLHPEIVLLDYRFPEQEIFLTIDEITAQFVDVAVIVILPENEIQNSNRVILAGARAFLLHPFTQSNLLETLERIHQIHSRRVNAQSQSPSAAVTDYNKTFVVFSPKGGVGTTTVATNLAVALHQETKGDVLLVDGKHLFGDVVLMLNLRTANSIADLIVHSGSLDESLIRQVVTRHVSGIQVLPSPFSITTAQGIRPDDLYKVVLELQKIYPTIVIDSGSYLSDNVVTYMDSALRILLVLNPDLASMRDSRQFLDIARSLSYPRDKITLLLNKTGRKADVNLADIERVLHSKVFGTFVADDNFSQSCLNEGVPMILKKPGHVISKAFKKLARDLVEVTALPGAVSAGQEVHSDVLLKTSRLG